MVNVKDKVVAISGVGGFIGLAVAVRVIEMGGTVRGIDNNPAALSKAEKVLGCKADLFAGDIRNIKDCHALCKGSEIVIHTAALVRETGEWNLFRDVNVEGTRNMITAAERESATWFLHLSSVMVYGYHPPPNVKEDGPKCPFINPYNQTKIEGEAVLNSFRGKIKKIIIRPGDVYGPGCDPWVVRALTTLKNNLLALPAWGTGIMACCYLDNLLDAIFLALEKEAAGEVFNIVDEISTTYGEYFDKLSRETGLTPPVKLPSILISFWYWLMLIICFFLRKQPPVHPSAMNNFCRTNSISCEKAKKQLGYKQKIGLDEGIKVIAKWAKDEKII